MVANSEYDYFAMFPFTRGHDVFYVLFISPKYLQYLSHLDLYEHSSPNTAQSILVQLIQVT